MLDLENYTIIIEIFSNNKKDVKKFEKMLKEKFKDNYEILPNLIYKIRLNHYELETQFNNLLELFENNKNACPIFTNIEEKE